MSDLPNQKLRAERMGWPGSDVWRAQRRRKEEARRKEAQGRYDVTIQTDRTRFTTYGDGDAIDAAVRALEQFRRRAHHNPRWRDYLQVRGPVTITARQEGRPKGRLMIDTLIEVRRRIRVWVLRHVFRIKARPVPRAMSADEHVTAEDFIAREERVLRQLDSRAEAAEDADE